MKYDGLGRRIMKTVPGEGDFEFRYYYDGRRLIETRGESGEVYKQHVWGMLYVDELVQLGINDDPLTYGTGDYDCETFYNVIQNANFNVMGLVDASGDLVERYEGNKGHRPSRLAHPRSSAFIPASIAA